MTIRLFNLFLAIATIVPCAALAQNYRGWTYLGDTRQFGSIYGRLFARKGNLIGVEVSGGNAGNFSVYIDCNRWEFVIGKNKTFAQIFEGSVADTVGKRLC
jgi:hypothetical protein